MHAISTSARPLQHMALTAVETGLAAACGVNALGLFIHIAHAYAHNAALKARWAAEDAAKAAEQGAAVEF